jgi:hypothetical protein
MWPEWMSLDTSMQPIRAVSPRQAAAASSGISATVTTQPSSTTPGTMASCRACVAGIEPSQGQGRALYPLSQGQVLVPFAASMK